MSKKAQAAEQAQQMESEEQQALDMGVQTSEPLPTGSDESAADERPQPTVRGRALIDIPAHDLKCGEFGSLPAPIAVALAADGQFDLKAVEA